MTNRTRLVARLLIVVVAVGLITNVFPRLDALRASSWTAWLLGALVLGMLLLVGRAGAERIETRAIGAGGQDHVGTPRNVRLALLVSAAFALLGLGLTVVPMYVAAVFATRRSTPDLLMVAMVSNPVGVVCSALAAVGTAYAFTRRLRDQSPVGFVLCGILSVVSFACSTLVLVWLTVPLWEVDQSLHRPTWNAAYSRQDPPVLPADAGRSR